MFRMKLTELMKDHYNVLQSLQSGSLWLLASLTWAGHKMEWFYILYSYEAPKIHVMFWCPSVSSPAGSPSLVSSTPRRRSGHGGWSSESWPNCTRLTPAENTWRTCHCSANTAATGTITSPSWRTSPCFSEVSLLFWRVSLHFLWPHWLTVTWPHWLSAELTSVWPVVERSWVHLLQYCT